MKPEDFLSVRDYAHRLACEASCLYALHGLDAPARTRASERGVRFAFEAIAEHLGYTITKKETANETV